MPFEDDPVLRQRAGLVRAEHVHGAEVLDRVQPLDDDLLARHRDGAAREVGGDDHRQHLRREADGDRDSEEERLLEVVLDQAVDRNTIGTITTMKRMSTHVTAFDAAVEAGERPLARARLFASDPKYGPRARARRRRPSPCR